MSDAAAERVVIFDHYRNLYWRANECGYAAHIMDAGLYDKAEAEGIVKAHAQSRRLALKPAPVFDDRIIVAIVKDAMRDAWNDICADAARALATFSGRATRRISSPARGRS